MEYVTLSSSEAEYVSLIEGSKINFSSYRIDGNQDRETSFFIIAKAASQAARDKNLD